MAMSEGTAGRALPLPPPREVVGAVSAVLALDRDIATISAGSPARAHFEAAFRKDVAGTSLSRVVALLP